MKSKRKKRDPNYKDPMLLDLEDARKELENEIKEQEQQKLKTRTNKDENHVHELREIKEIKEKVKSYKILYVITIILVTTLFLLYAFYPVINVLASKIESKTYVTGVIYFNDVLVHLPETVFEQIKNYYNEDVERALCLEGYTVNRDYFITGFYEPTIFSASYRHVSHVPCESIIMFHTHPRNNCLASYQDIQTLRKTQTLNEDRAMIIMCNQDRFSFYK